MHEMECAVTTVSGYPADLDVLALLKDPETLQDPYPLFAWLREHAPVYRNPTGGVYLVSRNEAAREAYQSPELRGLRPEELAAGNPRWESSRALRRLSVQISSTEGAEHARLRRSVSRYFTLRQVRLLQEAAHRHCDRLLAQAAARLGDGETVDLHQELSEPLGVNMAADIIGIPEADRETLKALVVRVLDLVHPSCSEQVVEAGDRASDQVNEYLTGLAAERRAHPREDLISAVQDEVSEGEEKPEMGMNTAEFLSMLWGLWIGSFETTVTAMNYALLAMLDFPQQASWLDGGPAEVKAFVEETLRYNPPVLVEAMPRIARRDIELSGITVPAGADVRPIHGAANRDPEAFPDPDRFDPARNTSRMVTFGHGIHHCLGAHLARMECAVVLTRVRRDLPGLILPERPTLRTAVSLRSFERFPVSL
jgi:cytochrome P450 family 114